VKSEREVIVWLPVQWRCPIIEKLKHGNSRVSTQEWTQVVDCSRSERCCVHLSSSYNPVLVPSNLTTPDIVCARCLRGIPEEFLLGCPYASMHTLHTRAYKYSVCCMQTNLSLFAIDWTKVSSMGQNCILPFGWDNFVPAIMFWDKLNLSMPRLITRKPTYKRRARNRHLHNCGITIISTFSVNG
jgi:hypothetical protein